MILAAADQTGVRLAEVGLALMAIAGGLLVLGAVTPFGRRMGNLAGGACLAAGAVLAIIATHYHHFG